MNIVKSFKRQSLLLILTASIILIATAKAADKSPATPAEPAQIRSVFVLPASPKDGRDPFFPESTRVYDAMMAVSQTNKTVEVTSLKVPGISGTPGHLFAIINNHTFAEGDEGDVLTTSGKLHLRCIKIEEGHVTVEVNGQNHRLDVGE